MIKAVIIDDEKQSRNSLSGLLQRYCHNVMLSGEADGVWSGMEVIKNAQPDVVFLDIQMQDGSGFKLLEYFEKIDFQVIFTTAFDQFAIRAFKYNALDYLLKPIVPQDLINAVNRAEKIKEKKKSLEGQNLDKLLENIKKTTESPKIILTTADKIHLISVNNIIRCESDNYYTRLFFTDGNTLLVSKTLKEVEKLLSDFDFIRPHKSHLVNVHFIRGFLKHDGGFMLMSDGTEVPVARRKKEMVLEVLNQL
ncbi:MAG TPA: LytTR family DNA-binding domain-containing protein [Bacteroidales bacterium]|nr:LytTR family DNA-binding domain-containing protein [Bacteroidales bacterium]HPR57876.1 LytTR family DNA-binding domain-containing protein [Bacteroidales bacterium]HRW96896.1 LytTR family DNA-binding domain-containing protein [Bacteroidales bacterium]